MGWTLCNAGQLAEAETAFATAAQAQPPGQGTGASVVSDYANLSRALVLLRGERIDEARSLARAIAVRNSQGHVQALAASILAAADRRLESLKKAQACEVTKLE
jgi:hypothetical protein